MQEFEKAPGPEAWTRWSYYSSRVRSILVVPGSQPASASVFEYIKRHPHPSLLPCLQTLVWLRNDVQHSPMFMSPSVRHLVLHVPRSWTDLTPQKLFRHVSLKMPGLRSLCMTGSVDGPSIHSAVLRLLPSLSELRIFSVKGGPLQSQVVASLARLPSLRYINSEHSNTSHADQVLPVNLCSGAFRALWGLRLTVRLDNAAVFVQRGLGSLTTLHIKTPPRAP
jgi:hypothetical protein